MRTMYCPACAGELLWERDGFYCSRGGGDVSPKLGHQIKRAVYGVEPFTAGSPRRPEIAPYVWCPNCTAPLDQHDDRERKLQCLQCGLSLPVLAHEELMENRDYHVERHAKGELRLDE